MSKRANPFIDDFVQQSKVHVGIKQFNNTDDRLKAVYEKTLQLLFKGAKKILTHDINQDLKPQIAHNRKHNLKQLCLDRNGTLLHNEVAEEKQVWSAVCACGGPADARCGYCEAALCGGCRRPCLRCDNLYCARCSIAGSEGVELCVSCYG